MPTTKIVYKGSNDQEFFVFANPGEVPKWRNDKSIPLVDVVQSFDVFSTSTGSQTGAVMRPSKGVLESVFNTSNKEDVVRQIVEAGDEKNM